MSSFSPSGAGRRADSACDRRRQQAPGEHRPRRPRQAGGDQARPDGPGLPGTSSWKTSRGRRSRSSLGRSLRASRARRPRGSSARPTSSPRRDGPLGLQPARAGLRVPPGADLRQHRARRRDQPCDAETQSSLLEAMAETRSPSTVSPVSSAALPRPGDAEPDRARGTFPLPEAQLDRFFLKTALGYPESEQELQIVRDQRHGHPARDLGSVVTLAEVEELHHVSEEVYVDELIQRWVIDVVRATRELDTVAIGASVRGSLALERGAGLGAPARPRLRDSGGRRRALPPSSATDPVHPDVPRRDPQARRSRLRRGSSSSASRRPRGRRPHSATRSFRSPVSRATDLTPARPAPAADRPRVRRRDRAANRLRRRELEAVPARGRCRHDRLGGVGPSLLRQGTDEFVVRERYAEEAPRVVIVADRRPAMSLYPTTCRGSRSRTRWSPPET